MCECCSAATLTCGEVLPGVWLVRATRDGHRMKEGDWGLVIQNDPFVHWGFSFEEDPAERLTDEEWGALDPVQKELLNQSSRRVAAIQRQFGELCVFDARFGYGLVERSKKVGYDPETGGTYFYWLYERVRKVQEEHLRPPRPVEVP